MSVRISKESSVTIRRNYLVSAGVFTLFTLGCEENIVVVYLLAQGSRLRIVIPLLDEENARLGTCMGFEGIRIETNYGKNPAALCNELANALVTTIIEPSLGQNNRHTSAYHELSQINGRRVPRPLIQRPLTSRTMGILQAMQVMAPETLLSYF
jgi:hypothetical protein